MNDFVSRLELELHSAAVRQESAGLVRGGVLPRVRLALPGLAGAAAVAAVVAIAIVVAGSVTGPSTPERATALPAELEGSWRLARRPGDIWTYRGPEGKAILRFLPRGSQRCAELRVAAPCYVIEDSVFGGEEWGTVSVAGDRLTLRYRFQYYLNGNGSNARRNSAEPYPPGVYRWRVSGGALRLTKIRDSLPGRARVLVSGPHARVDAR